MGLQDNLRAETQQTGDPGIPIAYDPIRAGRSTFRAGLSVRIHRWFRLTPSFGPDLVREMLATLGVQPGELVLDPFAGAGTTCIETSLQGVDCLGFEINPFLHFVGQASTNWQLDPDRVERCAGQVVERYLDERSRVSFEGLAERGYAIPPIHNPTRWWRSDVLADLLVLLGSIDRQCEELGIRDFLRLALAGVLVPDLTNVTLGRLQLHFIDRTEAQIEVLASFIRHVEVMLADLRAVHSLKSLGRATVRLQDSTDLGDARLTRRASCVITSPPYPNRYSYVWNTRPHLYLFGFLADASGAAQIDKRTIGGTWGTATSELQRGKIEPLNEVVDAVVGPTVEQIRAHDNLMANYAAHYFNRLVQHLLELEHVCTSDAKVAYVVGNSWLKGTYIPTDVFLAEILERIGLGFGAIRIHRFRRRRAGKDLFESIVYARRLPA